MTNPACPEQSLFIEFLEDDDLDPKKWGGLEEHLQHCDSCQLVLAAMTAPDSCEENWKRFWEEKVSGSEFSDLIWNESFDLRNAPTDIGLGQNSGAGNENAEWPTLSGYRIESELGRGGMGVVYLAEQLSIGRKVAIKTISPQPDHSELVDRLKTEAATLGKLKHPNVIPLYELCFDSSNIPCLVMQLVEGPDLLSIVDRNTSVDEITDWFLQIASGLSEVHAFRVVHRDIKPSNILMQKTHFDGSESKSSFRPILSDFGLAKQVLNSQSENTTAFAGTVRYMSPEQMINEGDWVKSTTDIYSLGVVMFRILAGQFPYSAENPLRLLKQIETEAVPSIRQFRPSVPAELDQIVKKCLCFSAADRYQTADELIADLNRFRLGEAIEYPHKVKGLPEKKNITFRRVSYLGLLLLGAVAGWYAFSLMSNQKEELPENGGSVVNSERYEQFLEQLRISVKNARDGGVTDWQRWVNARDILHQFKFQFPTSNSDSQVKKIENEIHTRFLESRLLFRLEHIFESKVFSELLGERGDVTATEDYERALQDFGVGHADQEIEVFFTRVLKKAHPIQDRIYCGVYDLAIGRHSAKSDLFLELAIKTDPNRTRASFFSAVNGSNWPEVEKLIQSHGGSYDPETTSRILWMVKDLPNVSAQKFLSDSQERFPDNYFVNLAVASNLIKRNQTEDAINSLKLSLAKKDAAKLRVIVGTQLMRLSKYKAAILHFRRAKEMDSNSSRAWFLLGECYELTGDKINGLEMFRYVQKHFPGFPGADQAIKRLQLP